MIEESEAEYKEICSQIDAEYKSVMAYGASAITLSGAAFAALLRLNDASNILFSHAVVIVANVTILIMIIINYKCSTYNRLIGYRHLLTSEHFDWPEAVATTADGTAPDQKTKLGRLPDNEKVISYDVCMEHINHVYDTEKFSFDSLKGEFFARKGVFSNLNDKDDPRLIEKYVAQAFPKRVTFMRLGTMEVDKEVQSVTRFDDNIMYGRDFTGRYKHILSAYSNLRYLPSLAFAADQDPKAGKNGQLANRKGSWKFPEYINRIVLYVVFIELFVVLLEIVTLPFEALSMDARAIPNDRIGGALGEGGRFATLYALLLLQFVIGIYLLAIVSRYWQELSFGCRRSFAFFLQFLPFRMIYLIEVCDAVSNKADLEKDKNATPVYNIHPYYVGTPWENVFSKKVPLPGEPWPIAN